jgi:tetratricopeptide (TPR) repeat protein
MRRGFCFAGLAVVAVGAVVLCRRGGPTKTPPAGYAGSVACRDCHADFYRLWSTSRHGLAMQPFTPAVAATLSPQAQDIVVGDRGYRAEPGAARVRETGASGERSHTITQVLGGKNVYYFLTPYLRGRLQVLPVAYDVRRRQWYDVAASGLRHFTDVTEHAADWTFPEFTFNTACHGCHASQLRSNYDRPTDSYRTTWSEPGINCETCHGPGEAHVRQARQKTHDEVRADPKLVVPMQLSHAQRNDLCASCHARLVPVADHFDPGGAFFDAFDLVGVEHRDFHPDGRDLGENYTFTGWRMSACAKSGQLDCLDCHTSSGRYRFADRGHAVDACARCHPGEARDPSAHSHHPAGATTCIECHMPKTEFARMVRTDHSMRAPAPAATLAVGSPNACNLCHADRDAAWSDHTVRAWYGRDYQAPVLRQARLVAAARKGDCPEPSAWLAAVTGSARDEVLAVAVLRLLGACRSDASAAAIAAAVADPSPWVRAAAAQAAGEQLTPAAIAALSKLTRDPVRLPRVRAANALTSVSVAALPEASREDLAAAMRELEASLSARPDDFASQYDLARLHGSRGNRTGAIAAYEAALKLRPDLVAALVNVSVLYSAAGRNRDAETALRRALAVEPDNAAAHLDLGMLLGELGRMSEAEAALRAALRADPTSAAAAYNLAVLLSRDRLDEAVTMSRRASQLEPASAKYAYTWAFYLAQVGDAHAAIAVLRRALDGKAVSGDSYRLLAALLGRSGRTHEAAEIRARAAVDARLSTGERAGFAPVRDAPADRRSAAAR